MRTEIELNECEHFLYKQTAWDRFFTIGCGWALRLSLADNVTRFPNRGQALWTNIWTKHVTFIVQMSVSNISFCAVSIIDNFTQLLTLKMLQILSVVPGIGYIITTNAANSQPIKPLSSKQAKLIPFCYSPSFQFRSIVKNKVINVFYCRTEPSLFVGDTRQKHLLMELEKTKNFVRELKNNPFLSRAGKPIIQFFLKEVYRHGLRFAMNTISNFVNKDG